MTDYFEVVRRQRAHRTFTDEPVPDTAVERILDAAVHAPSAENSQPWVFVVVRDAATRTRIGELTARAWDAHGREFERDRLSPALFADVDRGATGGISAAPVLVVVAGDASRCPEPALQASIFPAVQNLLLAAQALGLGSALTTLPIAFGAELRGLLGLPDQVRPLAVVPIGQPARPLAPPRRDPAVEKAHRERYGNPW